MLDKAIACTIFLFAPLSLKTNDKGICDMGNSKELNADIGKRIRDIREMQGKTREQVAEQADISAQFLFEIETGKKGMTARTIINLSKTLQTSTDYLLLGEGGAEGSDVLEGLPLEKQKLAREFLRVFAVGAFSEMKKKGENPVSRIAE